MKTKRIDKIDAKAAEHAEAIAKNILQLETLEVRKSDRRDFHDLAVWNIRDALKAAYKIGVADAKVFDTNR